MDFMFALLCGSYALAAARKFPAGWNFAGEAPPLGLVLPLLKCLPIWYLAKLALAPPNVSSKFRERIAIGLVLSSMGDFALDLDTMLFFHQYKDPCFIVGLGSFLCAHVFYILALRGDTPVGVGFARHILWALMSVSVGGGVLTTLWKGVPAPMRVPVVMYASAIALMLYSAMMRAEDSGLSNGRSGMFGVAGALVFVVSDTVLAVNKFLYGGQLPYQQMIVMTTYYGAQYLIATAATTVIVKPRKE